MLCTGNRALRGHVRQVTLHERLCLSEELWYLHYRDYRSNCHLLLILEKQKTTDTFFSTELQLIYNVEL